MNVCFGGGEKGRTQDIGLWLNIYKHLCNSSDFLFNLFCILMFCPNTCRVLFFFFQYNIISWGSSPVLYKKSASIFFFLGKTITRPDIKDCITKNLPPKLCPRSTTFLCLIFVFEIYNFSVFRESKRYMRAP